MWLKRKTLLILALQVVLYNGVVKAQRSQIKKLWKEDQTPESLRKAHGDYVKSVMNLEVDPCEDFYEYSCGRWKQDYSSITSLSLLTNSIYQKLIKKYGKSETLPESRFFFPEEEIMNDQPSGISTAEQKLIDLYKSCNKIKRSQVSPSVIKYLREIPGYPFDNPDEQSEDISKFNWVEAIGEAKTIDLDFIISVEVSPSSETIELSVDRSIQFSPLRTFVSSSSQCKIYNRRKIKDTLKHFNINKDQVEGVIDDIIEVDSQMYLAYNESKQDGGTFLYEELKKSIPEINWGEYFGKIELEMDKNYTIEVDCVECFKKIATYLNQANEKKVASYIFLMLMERFTEHISCSSGLDKYIKLPGSALFLRQYFSKEKQNEVLKIITDIRDEFLEFLENAKWIEAPSREAFIQKTKEATFQVGLISSFNFTDHLFNDFNDLDIDPQDFHYNFIQMRKIYNRMIHNSTYSSDTTYPMEVNAFYYPSVNSLLIPAGILQPPIYHVDYPHWAKYGSIGYILGHEMIHSFDISAFLKDSKGNIQKRVDLTTKINYFVKTLCIARQYNNFSFSGLKEHIDGVKTIGENAPDNKGLRLSYLSYKKWLQENGKENGEDPIPGLNLTSTQLFFVTFAQTWCDKSQEIRSQAVHSPSYFRIIGTVTNSEDFANEFQCPVGSPMNPKKKCDF